MPSGNYFVHTLLRARDWQHRPEFDQVCDWWRGGGRGVCALVGMGGAGKTAIAERFLRVLPGGLPLDPDVPQDESLSSADSTFVYSFYDDDKPENFFHALQVWLEGSSRVERASVSQLLYDVQRAAGFLVLDGLEKVQDDGARGVFGKLISPSLREFLDRLASGWVPDMSVLVTSRFPLADLRDARPQFFRTIEIEEIDIDSGIKLLRQRGVRGNDMQLEPIVMECGRHALTVDLAGGYIKQYGNGDPATPLNLGTTEELREQAEKEPDDDKRAVLKQGIRFARIAERYREAMVSSDEAALALLERICLFRSGVNCETIARIFTGPQAERVSGKSLASLTSGQLHAKLMWLVRMRLVEHAEHARITSDASVRDILSTRYIIHPAVRKGFLNGISRDSAVASHEAVCRDRKVSLGKPGSNPSDPATIDLLEEIVHHTLECNAADEAFSIYFHQMGGYENLGERLGQYERGEHICSTFSNGVVPALDELHFTTSDEAEARRIQFCGRTYKLFNVPYLFGEWGLFKRYLGDLDNAKSCYELAIALDSLPGALEANVARYLLNIAELELLSGRFGELSKTLLSVKTNVGTSKQGLRQLCHTFSLCAAGLRGRLTKDSFATASWIHSDDDSSQDDKLIAGIFVADLLQRCGRRKEAARMTEAGLRLAKGLGASEHFSPEYQLLNASIVLSSGNNVASRTICEAQREWALPRCAREVLCWSSLLSAQIEAARLRGAEPSASDREAVIQQLAARLGDGLRPARDCGYGLYHIDLLLEQARLHLFQSNPQFALDDIRLALDEGIPANDETGQPELLAANDEECGYAWGIVEGLHLRGEALLLQAAQTLGSNSFEPIERDQLPSEVRELIAQAESCLNDAMNRWRDLRDPEPTEDNNFVHPETGVEYNYKAVETYRVLADLKEGKLTRYPLEPFAEPAPEDDVTSQQDVSETNMGFDVFLSHNSLDKPVVRQVGEALKSRGLTVWLDEWELVPGRPWQETLEEIVKTTKAAAVLVGSDGLGPWQDREMRGCLSEFVNRGLPVIPVLLPDAPTKPDLPMFLKQFTWVDLRTGLTDDGLDRVQWGITGIKPGNPNQGLPAAVKPIALETQKPQGGMSRECKIVLFAANPSGTGHLALDKEVREIETKIRAAEHRDTLKLISKWAVRPDDLLQALNEHRPQIVHFSGHGSGDEKIILSDALGDAKPVSKAALKGLFSTLKDNIRLVVLNACFSQPQAETIVEYIDCAIGMTKAMGDDAAITFASSFYRALGFGRSVKEAFEQGRTALLLEGIPEENTPELLCKDGVDPSQVYLLNPL